MELAKRISEDILMKMKCGEFIDNKERKRVFKILDENFNKRENIDLKLIAVLVNNNLRPVKDPLHEEEIIYLIKEWKGN